MGLEKSIQKLDKYLERLSQGKAKKIKPSDLAKVERKLQAKKELLTAELEEAQKTSKKERLAGKLSVVNKQLERANWLRQKLSGSIEDAH
ncbi:hypothetical protein SAMN05444000_11211 [Shimia gijangensis]|uniref:Uncharacterized protein n=1 Tax=Shimia gijangensis TaxID=1470563 RepID=A0A1M6LIM8_9RHOB|nr:hypothetical protein [Shimia gijangensis]SHJ71053.1 hypothetical protein SAMN05444000_11211 [Shimia gijangensis]